MKRLIASFLIASSLSSAAAYAAETYEIDPTHTNVVWSASHLGFSNSMGKFADVSGTFTLDEAAPQNSTVDVTIKTASIMTGIPKFDEHLKNADFFNVEMHPTAHFKSTSIELTGDKTARIVGDLTLNGITKPLVLEATLNKIAENPFNKKKTAGFSLKGTIIRSMHKINYALPAVPDEVPLIIEAEGTLKEDDADSK